MQLLAFEGFQKVSLLGKVTQSDPHPPKPGDPDAVKKEKARLKRELYVSEGQDMFRCAVTDVHNLRKTYRFKDEVLPRFLAYMRTPNGQPVPDDLWAA